MSNSPSNSPALSYELVNVNELPSIDVTRSVKSVICSQQGLRQFDKLVRDYNRLAIVIYVASLPFDLAIFFVHETLGQWFAVVKLVCQAPLLAVGIVTLRVDMIKCLLWTYEFWFMSFMNLTTHIVFCVYFRDLRAVSMFIYAVGLQINVCVDANLQMLQLATTSLVYIFYQVVMLVTVSLHLTPDTHSTKLIGYKGRAICSQDFLLQSLTTIMVLMIRTAYRKRQFLKWIPASSVLTRCVVYKCRVKLQVRDPRAPSRSMYESMTNEIRAAAATMTKQQLRFMNQGMAFFEDDVMGIWAYNLLRDPSASAQHWQPVILYGTGICGVVFSILPFLIKKYSFQGISFTLCSVFSLLCVGCFIAVFVSCYNRRLLRELVFSFDFCYLSFQLSVVHLCVCDLFFWDDRCYFALFNWLAMHWVLTLDALTPNMRQSLGFNTRFAIPVVVFFILAILRISLDMVVLIPTRPFQNRLLWKVQAFDHSIEFRAEPVILSRAWVLLLWCFRILWRLCTSGENDRIVIQGTVEFVANRLALARRHTHQAVHATGPRVTSRQPSHVKMLASNQVTPVATVTSKT